MKEEKNSMKNNSNGLLIFIAVLLVILIAMGGFMIYTQYQNGSPNVNVNDSSNNNSGEAIKDEQENNNNIDSGNMEVSLTSNEGKKYIGFYSRVQLPNYDISNNYVYHKNDYTLVENLDDEIKTWLVGSNLYIDEYKISNGDYILPEYIFKDAYLSLFGRKAGYEFVDAKEGRCPGVLKENDKIYIYTQCGDTGLPGFVQQVYRIEKTENSDYVYVYEVVGYVEYYLNDTELTYVYKDSANKNLVIDGIENLDDVDLAKYSDKLDVYKYTFKKDTNDYEYAILDGYNFISVEKVK